MHDPGPLLLPASGETEQSVHERPRRVPRRGVHDQPGGLVDDEQVLVLVGDPQVHRLRDERRPTRRGRLEGDLLPTRQPVALRPQNAVDEHRPLSHEPLGRGPRAHGREPGDEAVEPLARRRVRNAQAERRSRAAGAAARGRRARA